MYDVLFPSFVAGIIGFHVATRLGVTYPHLAVSIIPPNTGWSFLEMILLGVWCGFIALVFIEIMQSGHQISARLTVPAPVKAVIGGILLVTIGKFGSPRYLGLGLDSIESGLRGELLPAASPFIKAIATAITLGCGGSGGVVTPIFFIGVTAGNLFAYLFHEPLVASFSAIGMVALLAGAANTPISASVLAIELFGAQIAPHAAVACMVSFLIVGHRSIYPSQVLGIQKSTSLKVTTGRPISEFEHVEIEHRRTSLLGLIIEVFNKMRHSKHV
jgi:H+/Cl- antiporter ClcA